MVSLSHFKDKTAVVLGAEHPLGAALVARLATFGAQVIAIAGSEAARPPLAAAAACRVVPLVLPYDQTANLEWLRDVSAETALHVYIDLTAVVPATAIVPRDVAFARSARVGAIVAAPLRRGAGRAVIGLPELPPDAPPGVSARQAGFAALLQGFAAGAAPARWLGLTLPGLPLGWGAADLTSAGDLVLMLCHPASRGLAGGQRLTWRAAQA